MDMKAISWAGNIYQKFETMCLEMEEAMYQDTVKYVENQVQTVGANVKRFYSEVMLDLHPQCNIDPVKVAAADLSLNPYAHSEVDKKLKANPKGYPRGISKELIDDAQVIKGKSQSRGAYKRQNVGIKEIARENHPSSKKSDAIFLALSDAIQLPSESKVREGFEVASDHITSTAALASIKGRNCRKPAKEVHDLIINTNVPAAHTSINASAMDMSLSVEAVGQSHADLRNTGSVGGLQLDSLDGYTDKELVGEIGTEIISNTYGDDVASEDSCKERSDKSCSVMPKKYDVESDVEIVEQCDESQLEETCVLVEDRLNVPQSPVKWKSYKKKLRAVFSTKKKLTRKEYEQLGALYGDHQSNLEAEHKVIHALATNSSTKKMSANDHSESEWELL